MSDLVYQTESKRATSRQELAQVKLKPHDDLIHDFVDRKPFWARMAKLVRHRLCLAGK